MNISLLLQRKHKVARVTLINLDWLMTNVILINAVI